MRRATAALLLVAGACSGGSDGGEVAARVAQRAQLTAADLGEGWTKTADEAAGPGGDESLKPCVGVRLDVTKRTSARSNVRTFERSPSTEDQQQVVTSTAVFRDVEDADVFFRIVRSRTFATCLARVFSEQVAQPGSQVTIVPGVPSTTASGGRDRGRRVRVTIPLQVRLDAPPVGGALDLLVVGTEASVSVVTAFSVGTPLPEGTLPRLGDLLLARQTAA